MQIRDIGFVGTGAMSQAIFDVLLHPRRYINKPYPMFNVSGWEYSSMYYKEIDLLLKQPDKFDYLKKKGQLDHVFFNFGEIKDFFSFVHPEPEESPNYERSVVESLQRTIAGNQLNIFGTTTEGLEKVLKTIYQSGIYESFEDDSYLKALCKGVIKNTIPEIKKRLITPYELMHYYLIKQAKKNVKISVGGGGTLAKEILDLKETFFKIFSHRFHERDMNLLVDFYTVHKFTAEKGYNRLLAEVVWASKNPYAIGAGIIKHIDGGENLRGKYIAEITKEVWAIYKEMLKDRPWYRFRDKFQSFGRDFVKEEAIADILTTCYSEDSRNFKMGLGLANGESIEQIKKERLKDQSAEGLKSTPLLLTLFDNPKKDVPILYNINEVINGGKTAIEAFADIIKLLKEREKKKKWYRGRKEDDLLI